NVERVAWFTARRDAQAQRVIEQSGDVPSTVDEPAMRAPGDQGDRRGSAGFGDHLVGAVPNDVMAARARDPMTTSAAAAGPETVGGLVVVGLMSMMWFLSCVGDACRGVIAAR
ncbi:MAG: hypothetical protein M3445_00185, partial [Actinomycetota bacterium]|nr:hypothetical protein [Actinomycetota bacterium]